MYVAALVVVRQILFAEWQPDQQIVITFDADQLWVDLLALPPRAPGPVPAAALAEAAPLPPADELVPAAAELKEDDPAAEQY